MQSGNKSTFPDVLPVINKKPGFRATQTDAGDLSESLKSKRTKIGQSALPSVRNGSFSTFQRKSEIEEEQVSAYHFKFDLNAISFKSFHQSCDTSSTWLSMLLCFSFRAPPYPASDWLCCTFFCMFNYLADRHRRNRPSQGARKKL